MSYRDKLSIVLKVGHAIIRHPKTASAAGAVVSGLSAIGAATLARMLRK